MRRILTAVVAMIALFATACGVGGTTRETAIADLQAEVGMTEPQAICAVNALEQEFGSIDFVDDPDSLDDDDAFRAGELIVGCMSDTATASTTETTEPSTTAPDTTSDEATSDSAVDQGARAEAIAELAAGTGITEAEATCAVDAMIGEFGSLDFVNNPDSVSDDEVLRAGGLLLDCAPGLAAVSSDGGGDTTTDEAMEDEATGDEAMTDDAMADDTEPAPVEPDTTDVAAGSRQGRWTADELCTLFDPVAVGQVFGASGPALIDAQYQDDELSICSFNDPDDPSLVPRGIVAVRQEPAGSFIQLEQPVDVTGADQVDYRPGFLDGRDFLVVEAAGQLITFDYWTDTPGALEFVTTAAVQFVANQRGEAAAPAANTGTDAADASDESASGALSPSSPDPGTDPTLAAFWTSCGAGDPDACDYLYLVADESTVYYDYGYSCGGREPTVCHQLLGDANGSLTPSTPVPGTDPTLDALWAGCASGAASDCDDLYFSSPIASDYEWFGFTCGGRGAFGDCQQAIDDYRS